MIDHPDCERLAAFLDGGLDLEARLTTMQHLADCDRCRALVAAAANNPVRLEHERDRARVARALVFFLILFALAVYIALVAWTS